MYKTAILITLILVSGRLNSQKGFIMFTTIITTITIVLAIIVGLLTKKELSCFVITVPKVVRIYINYRHITRSYTERWARCEKCGKHEWLFNLNEEFPPSYEEDGLTYYYCDHCNLNYIWQECQVCGDWHEFKLTKWHLASVERGDWDESGWSWECPDCRRAREKHQEEESKRYMEELEGLKAEAEEAFNKDIARDCYDMWYDDYVWKYDRSPDTTFEEWYEEEKKQSQWINLDSLKVKCSCGKEVGLGWYNPDKDTCDYCDGDELPF